MWSKKSLQEKFLEELEIEKQQILFEISSGSSSRLIRNYLYELLGVIDCKKRFSETFVTGVKDFA